MSTLAYHEFHFLQRRNWISFFVKERSKKVWVCTFILLCLNPILFILTWSPFCSHTAKQVLAQYPLHLLFSSVCNILHQISLWLFFFVFAYRISYSEGSSLTNLYNATPWFIFLLTSHALPIACSPRRIILHDL